MESKFNLASIVLINVLFLTLNLIDLRVTSQRNFTRRRPWRGHYVSGDEGSGSYGDYCNLRENINCDSKALLTCQNQICTCTHQDDMIFDVAMGQCVAKAGSKCTYGRDNFNQQVQPAKIPCVLNGVCGTDGLCKCLPGFFNSFNVTCLPQKGFEIPCHYDIECRADYHLQCIVGKCQCDPAVSVKHGTYELCLGLAGEKAIEGNCVEFSQRIPGIPKGNVICECLQGYSRGADKKCHGEFNQACTYESSCGHDFSCVQGTCKCPYPEYQTYSTRGSKCLVNAFGPCSSSVDCAPGSFCNTSGLYSKCDCKPGFMIGPAQHCEKSFGTSCRISRRTGISPPSMTGPMDMGIGVGAGATPGVVDECSASALLQCRDGKCSCADLKMFSEEQEKCLGLVGSICFKSNPSPICVDNSECVYRHERLGFGLCSCVPGFESNEERLCSPVPFRNISTEIMFPTSTITETDTEASIHSSSEIDLGSTHEETFPVLSNGTDSNIHNNTQYHKNLLEFYKFLNDTLYGGFDNASFTRFMHENFNLPD